MHHFNTEVKNDGSFICVFIAIVITLQVFALSFNLVLRLRWEAWQTLKNT